MKHCNGCGRMKPLDAFHRDRSASDGRQRSCKDCRRAYMRTPAALASTRRTNERRREAIRRWEREHMNDWPTCECGCGKPVSPALKTYSAKGWIKDQPLRYVNGHSRRGKGQRLKQLVALVINMPEAGCREWTFARAKGYGYIGSGAHASRRVHRVAWEMLQGPIPNGLEVHHTCRNRACVNVGHMELLTKTAHSSLHVRMDA